jgi:hypothetical protein
LLDSLGPEIFGIFIVFPIGDLEQWYGLHMTWNSGNKRRLAFREGFSAMGKVEPGGAP